jgi:RNA polymerase sigma factor (sigma-70 family)
MEISCTIPSPLQAIRFAYLQVKHRLGTHLLITSGAKKNTTSSHLQVAAKNVDIPEHPNSDEKFFHELFADNFDELILYAKNLTSDLDAAKDIVQDVFQNFWIKRNDIKGASNIKAYLFVSIRNMCYDYLKASANHTRIEQRLPYYLPFDQVATNGSNIEAEMTAAHAVTALKRALSNIPESHRQILELHFFQDLSITEIARMLNMNFNAVANLKFRAIANLRKQFNFDGQSLDNFL